MEIIVALYWCLSAHLQKPLKDYSGCSYPHPLSQVRLIQNRVFLGKPLLPNLRVHPSYRSTSVWRNSYIVRYTLIGQLLHEFVNTKKLFCTLVSSPTFRHTIIVINSPTETKSTNFTSDSPETSSVLLLFNLIIECVLSAVPTTFSSIASVSNCLFNAPGWNATPFSRESFFAANTREFALTPYLQFHLYLRKFLSRNE